MKRMKDLPKLETRTVALLTGLTIGLGIAVHDIFFVVTALIALVRPMESAVHWIYEHVTHGTLEHRHFVNTPQHMRHIKVCRSFARSTSAVAVAFVTGFLVFSGESLLHARHSVSTSQPAPRLCLRAPATNYIEALAYANGATVCLSKPVSATQLAEAMEQCRRSQPQLAIVA